MTAHGTLAGPGTLRFRRRLPGPLERVWSYLVDPDKRRLWLAGGPMDTRPGGAVELHFRNSELSRGDDPPPEKYREVGNAGTVRGEILRCEPPRLLAFTWGGGPDAGEPPSDVTIELEPDGDEVLPTLTHRRLAPGPQTLSVAGGWHTHLDILGDVLRGDQPRPFWRTHTRIEAEYAARGLG